MQDILKSPRKSLAHVSDLALQAISWWFSELSSMFPWLRRLDSLKASPALLRVGEHRCTLLMDGSADKSATETRQPAVELPGLGQLIASSSKLRSLCAGRALHVSVDAEDILPLEYELPAAARNRLSQAVAYKLLTESPIDPSLVFYSVRPRKDNSTETRLRVDVVIARKEKITAILNTLGKCEVSASEVGYALPGSRALDYVFHTSEMGRAEQARKRLHFYLWTMAIVVLTAYFPITIAAAKWLEHDTRRQILALQAPDKKQTDLQARQSHVQAVRQELAEQLPPFRMLTLINTVARHLPADAWVSRLEYANGKVLLAGQATNPSAALRQLRRSKLFSNAKLDAVASPANPGDPPQFEMSAVIAGGPN